MVIVVMGISGTGKSTIGKLLAEKLSLPFIEADDYHSPENIAKMRDGIPLTDEDRLPWLSTLSSVLKHHENEGGVLACSALKEGYRQLLQRELRQKIIWIYLEGRDDLLRQRMRERTDHFMPEDLLQSQRSTLEEPGYAYKFSVEEDPAKIVSDILLILRDR